MAERHYKRETLEEYHWKRKGSVLSLGPTLILKNLFRIEET